MLQDILTARKALFAAGAHTELRGQNSRNRRAVLLNGDVIGNTRSDVSGISARVYRGGVYGFSSMAEYSVEAAEMVLKAATENAAFMDKHAPAGKPDLPPMLLKTYPTQADINDSEQKLYVDFSREVDAYIAKRYPELVSRRLVAMEDSMEKLIVVSDATDAHIIAPRSYVYVMMTAQTKDGAPVDLFKAFGGKGTFDLNFKDPAALYPEIDALYERLMQKREGVYADAGEKTVILDGMMVWLPTA